MYTVMTNVDSSFSVNYKDENDDKQYRAFPTEETTKEFLRNLNVALLKTVKVVAVEVDARNAGGVIFDIKNVTKDFITTVLGVTE